MRFKDSKNGKSVSPCEIESKVICIEIGGEKGEKSWEREREKERENEKEGKIERGENETEIGERER